MCVGFPVSNHLLGKDVRVMSIPAGIGKLGCKKALIIHVRTTLKSRIHQKSVFNNMLTVFVAMYKHIPFEKEPRNCYN